MSRTARTRSAANRTAVVTLALLVVAACGQDERRVDPTGFLGDYSQLEPGRADQAALLYLDASADFSPYQKVLIEPVAVWHEGSQLREVPQAEAKRLAEHFERELREELGRSFELVEQPGPDTLRVRSALTEAVGSKHTTDLGPVRGALAAVREMATGTRAFVGRAAIEVEILDAETGERLVAAVDQRAGDRSARDPIGTWADAESALDYWARVIAARLAAFRGIDAAEASWEAQQGSTR